METNNSKRFSKIKISLKINRSHGYFENSAVLEDDDKVDTPWIDFCNWLNDSRYPHGEFFTFYYTNDAGLNEAQSIKRSNVISYTISEALEK